MLGGAMVTILGLRLLGGGNLLKGWRDFAVENADVIDDSKMTGGKK